MKKTISLSSILFILSPTMFSAEELSRTPHVTFLYSEMFLQIAGTILLILLIKKFAWKNFLIMLEERQLHINKNIEEAETSKEKAEALAEKRTQELSEITSKKKEIIATTISSAKEEEKKIVANAKHKSQELLEKNQMEIMKEKEAVKEELTQELANISIDLVKKFMFDELTQEQEKKLIQQATSKVASE